MTDNHDDLTIRERIVINAAEQVVADKVEEIVTVVSIEDAARAGLFDNPPPCGCFLVLPELDANGFPDYRRGRIGHICGLPDEPYSLDQ